MEKLTFQEAGRQCIAYNSPHAEMLMLQPVDEHDREELDLEVETIQSLSDKPFLLVAFEVNDWQADLTPWAAPPAFGKTPFGDGAEATLSFIVDHLLPALQALGLADLATMRLGLGGYSLAGLFALWAGYRLARFDGIVAASPSVWYDNWMDYAATRHPLVPSIYLSLGDKEEKARNPRMARVGDCIRRQHELLISQGIHTTLEWNSGNHFKDAGLRMAKGFAWLLNR